jgi:hypothetical protein
MHIQRSHHVVTTIRVVRRSIATAIESMRAPGEVIDDIHVAARIGKRGWLALGKISIATRQCNDPPAFGLEPRAQAPPDETVGAGHEGNGHFGTSSS